MKSRKKSIIVMSILALALGACQMPNSVQQTSTQAPQIQTQGFQTQAFFQAKRKGKWVLAPQPLPTATPQPMPTPSPSPVPAQPAHLTALQNLLDGDGPQNRLQPADNNYSNAKIITWPGQGTRSNDTVCAPLVTLTLKHAYGAQGLTDDTFQDLADGSNSPYPWKYVDIIEDESSAFNAQNQSTWEFEHISDMSQIEPGDLMAIDYLDNDNGCSLDNNPNQTSSSSTASGHMTVVESMSNGMSTTLPGSNQPAVRYDLVVLDSSSSYHGTQDTRFLHPQSAQPFEADSGLGRGTMRFYADPQTGEVMGYKWSTTSSSTCRPHQRKAVFGRLHQS